jgi:fused signal recognition particle receptor
MGLLTGLKKSRISFWERLKNLLTLRPAVDADLLDDLEEILIASDMGVDLSLVLIERIQKRVAQERLKNAGEIINTLKEEMKDILTPPPHTDIFKKGLKPVVFLIVGVNGSGKTTTAAKLSAYFRNQDKKVMMAACDTFRAAAIDQLAVWAERTQAEIVRQSQGSDSASVAFDALNAAKARACDVLLVDTAGRLHTKANLMAELQKIKRVLLKNDAGLTVHTLLVLDGTGGQNSLAQAREFNNIADIDGLIITKLDGTAKGGAVFSICRELNIPIEYLGTGERIDDLNVFDIDEFVNSYFLKEN